MQSLKVHRLRAKEKFLTFEMRTSESKHSSVYVEFGPKSCVSHLIAISSYYSGLNSH